MKITMARGEMFDALSVVTRGLSSRSTLPILSGILIGADSSGSVTFQTTDLEVSVKTAAAAAVDRPGKSVIPGKLLIDIVRAMPETAVTLDADGDSVSIIGGQSSFSLRTLKADDFPRFPEVEIDKTITVGTEIMSDVIAHVSKAVSRDETRPILTGVLFVTEGPSLKMVATDSYRLAVKEVVLEEATTESLEVVVPGRALEEAIKLATGEKNISLGVAENQIVFTTGATVFIARRIEGSFPNYRQLIPDNPETKVIMKREDLLQAVKRVSLMAQHNTPLRVSMSSEDQTVSLSATTQDVGDASEDIAASIEGPGVEIAFNHSFLTDGIISSKGEKIELSIVSPLKPGVLTSKEDEGFLYLLMPVRLG